MQVTFVFFLMNDFFHTCGGTYHGRGVETKMCLRYYHVQYIKMRQCGMPATCIGESMFLTFIL